MLPIGYQFCLYWGVRRFFFVIMLCWDHDEILLVNRVKKKRLVLIAYEAASTKSLVVKSLPLPNEHNLLLAVLPVLRR
jgi:hypothetical protein